MNCLGINLNLKVIIPSRKGTSFGDKRRSTSPEGPVVAHSAGSIFRMSLRKVRTQAMLVFYYLVLVAEEMKFQSRPAGSNRQRKNRNLALQLESDEVASGKRPVGSKTSKTLCGTPYRE